MKPLPLILTLALTASLTLRAQDITAPQSWTASDGRVITAKFIKLDGESVVIEKDGKQFAVPFAKLKPESVAQAQKLGGVQPSSPSATDAKAIASSEFLGKTFEECERILGTPVEVVSGKDGNFARFYKSSVPGVSRIKLERIHEGSMDGPVPATVNSIWYYFPKGETKNLGEAFAKISLDKEGAKVTDWDKPLQGVGHASVDGIKGKLRAMWGSADASKTMPPEYQHGDEDTMWVTKDPNLLHGGEELVLNDSPELRKNGAFGFPQSSAQVLADQPEARFSAWSNADWLYVQIVVWADGDDSVVKGVKDKEECDRSLLCLDLDADQKDTPQVDRTYHVDPAPDHRGLRYQFIEERSFDPAALHGDSKGRGSIQFVPAESGKKIRVDSFLLPLSELGRKPGDKVRLILSGKSVKPDVAFNSAGLRTKGRAMFYTGMPKKFYRDFTLGQQSGSLEATQVPDDRK